MKRIPLYMYERTSDEQDAYLAEHGWHFSKKACEHAVSLMRKRRNSVAGGMEPIKAMGRVEVEEILRRNGVELEKREGYDHVYVANKCLAVCMGSSIVDELHLALYVKDVIDDVDAGDGSVFYGWIDGMRSLGHVIDWEGMI